MTSFSLLKFKFTQIFPGQNGFFKNERIIGEYGQILIFQKITTNFTRRPNFSKFHRFFLNFLNIDRIGPLNSNFFAPHEFSNPHRNKEHE
jgi:hypothetical protein